MGGLESREFSETRRVVKKKPRTKLPGALNFISLKS